MSTEVGFSLQETAEHLGVHYMTVYRYIRTGRLVAHQAGTRWRVSAVELERFRRSGAPGTPGRGTRSRSGAAAVRRLVARLLAGDENGSWAIVQETLAGGGRPKGVYLDMFVPALKLIGDSWERGEITVADEHRASVVMHRLIGRMGPLFRNRGPRSGTVVVGAPAGEMHALPTALVADILRGEGFDVVDLGANVPPQPFVTCALAVDSLVGIAIAVTMGRHRPSARILVRAFRAAGIDVPILVGGAGVTKGQARALGADHWTADADAVVRRLTSS